MGNGKKAAPGRHLDPGTEALSRMNLNAAGIDVGAQSHYVAVPEAREEHPVQEFGAYTQELYRLAEWLLACGVDTVAMESTGVYWIPLFGILREYIGFPCSAYSKSGG